MFLVHINDINESQVAGTFFILCCKVLINCLDLWLVDIASYMAATCKLKAMSNMIVLFQKYNHNSAAGMNTVQDTYCKQPSIYYVAEAKCGIPAKQTFKPRFL